MAGEEPRCLRQCEDALNASVERASVTAGKVRAGGPEVGHEQRIVDEGGVPEEQGDRRGGVAGAGHRLDRQFPEGQPVARGEQAVPRGRRAQPRHVVEPRPDLLHHLHRGPRRRPRAEPPAEVAERREVVGVGVGVDDPLRPEPLVPHVLRQGVGEARAHLPGRPIEAEHGVDDGAASRGRVRRDVG